MVELTEEEVALLERYFCEADAPQSRAYLDATHPKQSDFVEDTSERIVATCGRRGGKTDGVSRRLVRACKAGGLAIYFALSRPYAKRLMWGPLKRLNRDYNLGMVARESDLQMHDPQSGGEIWLLGVNTVDEREKARGHAITEASLDEAGTYGKYLEYLVDEILDPAMQDHGGTIAMTGTPPRVGAGLFFEASTGQLPGWSRHTWNVFDNSLFPRWRGAADWQEQAKQWFGQYLIDRGWSADDPHIRREWFAEWIRDSNSLVYKFDRGRNTWTTRPDVKDWVTILGVDLGYEDDTAWSVLAYSREDERVVELETFKRRHLIASEVAEITQSVIARHRPIGIRGDSGGLGKMLIKEYQKRYKIPIKPAEKNAKYDYIEHLNSDLQAGKILIDPKSPLADEWSVLQWDENRHKEDDRFANHCADAFLYAWREAQHYRSKTRQPLPKSGTREYYDRESERMKQKALSRAKAKNNRDMTERLL